MRICRGSGRCVPTLSIGQPRGDCPYNNYANDLELLYIYLMEPGTVLCPVDSLRCASPIINFPSPLSPSPTQSLIKFDLPDMILFEVGRSLFGRFTDTIFLGDGESRSQHSSSPSQSIAEAIMNQAGNALDILSR